MIAINKLKKFLKNNWLYMGFFIMGIYFVFFVWWVLFWFWGVNIFI